VDLHDVRDENRLSTLLDDATEGAVRAGLIRVEVGDYVQVLDEEGNTCLAFVEEVTDAGVIRLKLDWSTWMYAPPHPELSSVPRPTIGSEEPVYSWGKDSDTQLDPSQHAQVELQGVS